MIFDVTNERVETNFRPIEELLTDGWKQLEELYERQEHLTGSHDGLPEPGPDARRAAPRRPASSSPRAPPWARPPSLSTSP